MSPNFFLFYIRYEFMYKARNTCQTSLFYFSMQIDTYLLHGDHTILFQMPEILLFDIFEQRSGDGMNTGVL